MITGRTDAVVRRDLDETDARGFHSGALTAQSSNLWSGFRCPASTDGALGFAYYYWKRANGSGNAPASPRQPSVGNLLKRRLEWRFADRPEGAERHALNGHGRSTAFLSPLCSCHRTGGEGCIRLPADGCQHSEP